jgi:hypothetical protein
MRFHPDLHWPDMHLRGLAGRLHWPRHARDQARAVATTHTSAEDVEVAKAILYTSVAVLVMLLVVLAAIAFGQEALHWLGVY